ncbi:hypothetical protein LTR86_003006 [Recurvomyces mirabilis]|nr:hypothetical protein LTR86_003006 [Recurvomyces mirabilis]
MGGNGNMTWDAVADRKLLLGVLKVHDIKVDYESLAKYMATDEHKPTALSISKRLIKLKAMAKDDNAGGGNTEDTTEKTPRRRGKADTTSTPRKRAAKGKKTQDVSDYQEDEEDNEVIKGEGKDDSEEGQDNDAFT